jgi:hypothetical protein
MPIISGGSGGAGSSQGTEIGYDQITSNVNVTGTVHGTETTIITAAAHTFDGSPVLFQFFSPAVQTPTAALGTVTFDLYEGVTQIACLGIVFTQAAGASLELPISFFYRFTPSAASHTYLVSAYASATTGTPFVGAGNGGTTAAAYPPAFMRFTKV